MFLFLMARQLTHHGLRTAFYSRGNLNIVSVRLCLWHTEKLLGLHKFETYLGSLTKLTLVRKLKSEEMV